MRVFVLRVLSLLLLTCAAGAQENPITNGSFEQLDAQGFPVDWSPVSEFVTVTQDARTGQRALRFARPAGPDAPPEVGLNRAWTPQSGEQGKMLAETRGGIIFWYKVVEAAPDAALSFQVIPMSAKAFEDTGEPRVIYLLPKRFAGDGQWHEGRVAYDFSGAKAVKWVHVGVRLTGGPAVLLLDDVRYVDKVGPLLAFEKVHLYPDAARPGDAAELTASVVNSGDTPAEGVSASLRLPDGLAATVSRPIPSRSLAPGAAYTGKWRLAGRLRPGDVHLEARAGNIQTEYVFPIASRVEVVSLLASPSMVVPGGAALVEATLWNRGTAVAEGLRVTLNAKAPLRLEGPPTAPVPAIAPGKKTVVRWRVRAPRVTGSYPMTLQIVGGAHPKKPVVGGAPLGTRSVLLVTDALSAEARPLTASLVVRTGADRTLGEMVLPGKPNRVCARLPHLGRVLVRLPDGSRQEVLARYGAARQGVLTGKVKDRAGGVWTFRAEARAVSPATARLGIQVSCNQAREVFWFEGPVLLAGEGSTGPAKGEAIFPGLEWLAPDEVSSSDLDIAPEHADRLRFTPHPHKVTIPAMGVQTPQGVVGLLWDVHQRWDGKRELPQPVYAVPDRLEGSAAHRLGLAAPNVPAGLPEGGGRLESERGMALRPNHVLRLIAYVYADAAAKDVLAVLDEWFRWFRPDPILPAPQGSDRDQVAWSMRAYTHSLFVSPEEGWLPFLGGPAIWRKPAFDASFAYDLEQATRICAGHPEAGQWAALRERLRSRIPVARADDVGLAGPRPLPHLGHLGARVFQLVAEQAEDGSWAFDADRRDQGVFKGMDYHLLGPHGAVELGTIARQAYEILYYARMTGDEGAFRAGVKALERMAGFRIPRAAQVWEVPVHTPDILAAADAVDAYIEAYRFTVRDGRPGERRWLDEARRWARAGLPFVYVWSVPGKPWMRYGSIPVFGATWYAASWFGNIVQWNGLRYAYALLKLHELDPKASWGGLSWRDWAVGITRCAMYQQSLEGENQCLWPDSYHTVTDQRAAWDFSPRLILKNVYKWLDRVEEPVTVAVSIPGGVVRVSASATVEEVRFSEGILRARIRRHPGETGSVVVAGIARPTAVRANGQTVGFATRQDDEGWYYDADRHLLAVPAPGTTVQLEIEGVTAAPARPMLEVAERIAFEFADGPEGWMAAHDLALLEVAEGILVLQPTGSDPYLERHLCRIAGDSVREIVLRMRGSGDGGGQFFWTTRTSPAFDEAKSVKFHFPTDGQWHEVVVPVGAHDQWRGETITALRLDPGSTPNVRVEVDWIRGR